MKFPDGYPIGYHVWFLPQESITKDIEKINELKSVGEIHPMYIKFIPCENNNYKLIYHFYYEICRDNDKLGEDFEVYVDDLPINEMKDIIIKSLYDSLIEVDHMDTNYLFNDREPIGNRDANYEYHNMVKFSRVGMRDTFNYIRKK